MVRGLKNIIDPRRILRRAVLTAARPVMEQLEGRTLLSLLGVSLNYPMTTLLSQDAGAVEYSAAADLFHASAVPIAIKLTADPSVRPSLIIAPKSSTLDMQVDNAGVLLGGVAGDDFVVTGTVTLAGVGTFSGTLLTAEIHQFGYLGADNNSVSTYDFRLTPTGGQLAPYFAGKDVGMVFTSENSTFTGSFGSDFQGTVKGTIGPIDKLASLSGFVYYDANNNGLKDGSEPGIASTIVTLSGTDNKGHAVLATTTTAADGSYSFVDLPAGTYDVTETQPADYLPGKNLVGSVNGSSMGFLSTPTTDVIAAVTLYAGDHGVDYDFGEILPGSLSGFVYVDANNDGLKQPGETPLSGVTLTLTGADDLGAIQSRTTTTAADGAYSFGDLRPGTYTVTETHPAGYFDGLDALNNQVIVGSAQTDAVAGIAVGSAEDSPNNNFGELVPASIGGYVYVDANDNGLKETGEAPIAGVTVELSGTDDLGSVSLITTTAADGAYSFGGLRPGTYVVIEYQPEAYLDGKDAVGSLGGTLGNDILSAVPVSSGAAGVNYNFGEVTISNTPLIGGMTATIGYWQNKNGQALINALNGGPTARNLGNWLGSNFGALFGNLAGMTNAQVAAYYKSLFSAKGGDKADCQVLCAALALYVTDGDLAGTAAERYGFIVSSAGTGGAVFNVGSLGTALGETNNTSVSIYQLLADLNAKMASGASFTKGSTLRTAVNTLFTSINETGDI